MAVYSARSASVWFPTIAIIVFIWSFLRLSVNTQPYPSSPESVVEEVRPKKSTALEKEPLRIYMPPDDISTDTLYDIPGLHHAADSPPATYPSTDSDGDEIPPLTSDISSEPPPDTSAPDTSPPDCPIQPFDVSKCPSVQRLASHGSTPQDCPIQPFDIKLCPPTNTPLVHSLSHTSATDDSASASKSLDRPLILYAYYESDFGRVNLAFFVNHGLHDAADFIFILNGETDVDQAILPNGRHNVRIIKRENTCFDLGAHAEVLSNEEDGRALKDRYKRFILMNASIRGPFVPHWSKECWSEAYLGRLNDKVKLVGSSLNCLGGESPHVQSMIWATDSIGLPIILEPDGIGECFESLGAAMGGEIRTTPHLRSKGYEVDVMLSIFQTERNYKYIDCKNPDDFLFQDSYFGFNVHPYETLFVKSHRGIEDGMLEKLSAWEDMSGYTSYDVCGT